MTLAADDRRLAQATVTLEGESDTNGFVNGHAMLHHRWFPRIELDGRDSLDEVVTMSGVNLDLGPAYRGSATLEVFDSPSEELVSLAPREIIGGYFRSVGYHLRRWHDPRGLIVSRRIASSESTIVSQAERDIRARLEHHELDFTAMSAVSNIYRAGSAVRNHMERTLLTDYDLSWVAFTVLWVLWIWDVQETGHVAAEAGITRALSPGS